MVLGDRPSQVTARRMGDAVLRGAAPPFLAACAASAAADYAAASASLPGGDCDGNWTRRPYPEFSQAHCHSSTPICGKSAEGVIQNRKPRGDISQADRTLAALFSCDTQEALHTGSPCIERACLGRQLASLVGFRITLRGCLPQDDGGASSDVRPFL